MTRGDILNVLSTGYIGTTDPNGVGIALSLGTAPTKININGEVSGNKAGIHFSGPATSSLLVTLGTQGSLTGNNGPAIDAAGTNTDRLVQIVNHGLIYTAGSDIAIRFGNCDMKISNYGTIASDAVGTAILATGVFGYVGTATVLNRGVIQRAVTVAPTAV